MKPGDVLTRTIPTRLGPIQAQAIVLEKPRRYQGVNTVLVRWLDRVLKGKEARLEL